MAHESVRIARVSVAPINTYSFSKGRCLVFPLGTSRTLSRLLPVLQLGGSRTLTSPLAVLAQFEGQVTPRPERKRSYQVIESKIEMW